MPPRRNDLRGGPITRSTKPIAQVNTDREARRRKTFRAFFSTSFWRELRERVLERDGYRCVNVIDGIRCPNCRVSGVKLIANHKTYARFGGAELLEDVETLCEFCNAIATTDERANWKDDRRRHTTSIL
jgi:5-methylcytosine-specific restriction endonuclease McrA